MFAKRPRDENGWRVPSEGTMSRRIYDMLREGRSIAEISLACGSDQVPAYAFLIKNPDYQKVMNKRRRLARRQERQAQIVSDDQIETRLATIERERTQLLDRQLQKNVEEWIARIGLERAMAICRLVWPDNPAYADPPVRL